ncbi:MAG: hypothetical protein RL572_152, partial [Pseudomonadota bacterium]
GRHQGLMYHTYGQRQGLGIGGLQQHGEAPWYVVGKDLVRNVLLVAQGNEHPSLFSSSLLATQLAWINRAAPALPLECTAKIRYRQADQVCRVAVAGADAPADSVLVRFAEPQRAVTPGQTIVFYQDDICLGGAVIAEYFR